MTDLPVPITPADCDLRDFAFMPLDVVRLRDSDLAVTADADEFRCAVLLWCASWHQVPAASLPDDDKALAQYAGYGRVVKEWQKVREGALRGWIKCSDSRLYHPVVAEKANDAWVAKLKQRLKTECARIKKHNERHGTQILFPDFDSWMSSGCPVGQPLLVPSDKPALSTGQAPVVPSEMASKGEGEGQGQGNKEEIPIPLEPKSRRKPAIALQTFLENCKTEGRKPIPNDAPVFAYATQASIPHEFLRLQWLEFKDRYGDGSKRYKDWATVFSKSVRGNWFKLWFANAEGGYALSTIGVQAQKTHEGKK